MWQVTTPRGTNPWTRCDHCSAYFLVGGYALDAEVAHTETLPWGQLQAGLDLNAFKHRMFTEVIRHVARFQPPPARVLDVGCSFGGFGIEATRAGYDVYGMDITPGAVEYVRSLGMEAECCSTPADLHGLADESLDVVSCLDCHALWPDQPSQIAAIHRKLRPDGYLVMRVIDKSWMFTIGRRVKPFMAHAAARVMREAVNDNRFSMPLHSLTRQLAEQGFEVLTVSIGAAIHSHETRRLGKASFALGGALWPLLRRNYGPAAVVIARRLST